MKHSAKQFRELNLEAGTHKSVDDYRQILLNSVPIIDVRSPSEFTQGTVPNAANLPLLTDDEREIVGLAFKAEGQKGALAKGLELLSQKKRIDRVLGWTQFLEEHPSALICCWRGGLRSKVVQSWLQDAGWRVPRIVGGCKALRTYCMSVLNEANRHNYVVVAGRTGSCKTQLINELQPALDLEGLACHRGSAFGGDTANQPPPISFESTLATELLRLQGVENILVEDESRVIGKLAIPESLFRKLGQSPVVVVHAKESARVQYIYESYVLGTSEADMLSNLGKIRKRLGTERFIEVQASLRLAYLSQKIEDHLVWLTSLLRYYYDPMYDYQLELKKERVVFQGSEPEVKRFLTAEWGFAVQ